MKYAVIYWTLLLILLFGQACGSDTRGFHEVKNKHEKPVENPEERPAVSPSDYKQTASDSLLPKRA